MSMDDIKQEREKQSREAAMALCNAVNPYGFDVKAFADQLCHREHRTLQQSAMRAMFECLKVWAKDFDDGCYDLRNAATVATAHGIIKTMEEQRVPMHFPCV